MYQKEQKSRSKSSSSSNSSSQEKKGQPSKKKQTHLEAVASSKDRKPELAVEEIHHIKHGEEAHAKSKTKQKFKENYREPQIKFDENRGGAGFDEEMRTSLVADKREELQGQNVPNEKIQKGFVGNASEQRVPVVNELWSTGDPEQPLGGHPGSLSKDPKNMSRGLTKGHPAKDDGRASSVNKQYENKLKTGHNVEEATKDAKLIAASITTTKFMPPAQQLNQVDVSSSNKDAFSAKHGPIIKERQKQPGFEKLTNETHNERERRKKNEGHALMESGHEGLVAPEMRELLNEHDSPEAAINASSSREQSSDNSNRPAESQAFQGVSMDKKAPKTLDELDKINENKKKDNPNAKQVHAVSPPRSPKLPSKKPRK